MQYKKWDEWDSEHEQFIVLSYYGQPDFVFSINKLPNFRFDEANSIHEEYLKRLREAYRKHLKKDGYEGYSHDIKLVWKMGLTDKEIESLLNDHRPVKQWLKSVAIQVKESLEAIVKFKVERLTELDDSDSIDPVPANVERPDNITSFPIDSFSPVVPDGSVPVPFVASRKETVSSCTAEVKPLEDENTRLLRSTDKNIKGVSKKLDVLIEGQKQQTDIIQQSFELQQQAILKNAEQTPPPSPEQPQEADNQIDWDALEKELASVKVPWHIGEKRRIMKDKWKMRVGQIWEYENPGSLWKSVPTDEKSYQSKLISDSIRYARKKQSQN